MTEHTPEPSPSRDPPARTRRGVLRRGAAAGLGIAGLGAVGLGGTATGQETGQETANGGDGDGQGTPTDADTGTPETSITTQAAIRDPEEIDQGVGGFWIHLAEQLEPYEASVADRCAAITWSDLEAMAFDATLIDRQAEPEQLQITVFLHDAVEVRGGELFIVNEVDECDGEFLAVELERIGAPEIQVGPRATDLGGGAPTTEGEGPEFGALAALGGLVGGDWLARRRGDE